LSEELSTFLPHLPLTAQISQMGGTILLVFGRKIAFGEKSHIRAFVNQWRKI
jgi:hypothetical protein